METATLNVWCCDGGWEVGGGVQLTTTVLWDAENFGDIKNIR